MKITRNLVLILTALSVLGCSTLVKIQTDPETAKVYVNDKPVGISPVATKLSNSVFKDYLVRIEKSGYKSFVTELQREVKVGNLVVGILLLWPLVLWCYGPKIYYSFELEEN